MSFVSVNSQNLLVYDDGTQWRCMVGGLEAPFLHGEYFFTMSETQFQFQSVSGVYIPNYAVNIPTGYTRVSYVTTVVSNLLTLTRGPGILSNTPNQIKQLLANASRERNRVSFKIVYDQFESFITSMPTLPAVVKIVASRIPLLTMGTYRRDAAHPPHKIAAADESEKAEKESDDEEADEEDVDDEENVDDEEDVDNEAKTPKDEAKTPKDEAKTPKDEAKDTLEDDIESVKSEDIANLDLDDFDYDVEQ